MDRNEADSRPRVSVVIPVHNGASFIREAVESALEQEQVDLEVIVLDNASTDGTAGLLAAISDPRLHVERRETLIPVEQNWTAAISAARGDYIKLLCADDVLLPGCLAAQVTALDAHPSAVMSACARRIIDERGRTIFARVGLNRLTGLVPGRDAIRASVRAGTNIFGEPACVLFRGDQVRACMPWSSQRPYVIDLDLYFRLLHLGDIVMQSEVLAAFRVTLGSWSHALRLGQAGDFIGRVRLESRSSLSSGDVAIGAVRALGRQALREVVYARLRLGRRLVR